MRMNLLKDNVVKLIASGFFFVFLASASISVLTASQSTKQPSLNGNIQIFKRQLIVNGAPFVMKGICYSPVPKNCTQDQSLLIKPVLTDDDLALITQDFQMMQAAGVNTIRTYKAILNPQILALLDQYHLRTIVPIADAYTDCTSDPLLVSTIVNTLKNESSTLLWEIGNEWNYNRFYTATSANPLNFSQCADFINSVITQVRAIDTTHPISTNFGEIPTTEDGGLWSYLKNLDLDLYGTNLYPNGLNPQLNHPFSDRFKQWCLLSGKPLYLGEFGANAFPGISEDDYQQATTIKSLLKQVFGNLSAKHGYNALVGGCVFEWSDEWWKDTASTPDVHYNDSETLLKAPNEDTSSLNQEWWGIVDIDRIPRPSYNIVKNFYTGL